MPPIVISEEIPHDPATHHCDSLDLWKPLGGHLWWNSLYWTNFPPLNCLAEDEGADKACGVKSVVAHLNSDSHLAEQYVSYGAAREDLCRSSRVTGRPARLTVECVQYEGVRVATWNFPLFEYSTRRDNHQPSDLQSRRFWDNGVVHLGLNAEEFSERMLPVSELDACIHIADKSSKDNPTWGYHHALLRIAGWPFRIGKLGSAGDGSGNEVDFGICHWDEDLLWNLLSPSQNELGNYGVAAGGGRKFWASLLELDSLGGADSGIPAEKGFVWFTVVTALTVPSTGRKGVKIELLDEGIVPAWLDLNFLQVFAGGMPLGHVDRFESDVGEVTVYHQHLPGKRKVVAETAKCKLVFDEPMDLPANDFVDLGWVVQDTCQFGSTLRLSPKPVRRFDYQGDDEDEGCVGTRASGPPPLCHGEGKSMELFRNPLSKYPHERRLVI